MSRESKFVKFKKGDIIFRQGDEQDWLYEVFYGVVGLYGDYGKPEECLLRTLRENTFFGEMSVLEQKPRSETAVALEDVALKKITEEQMLGWFHNQPAFALRVMQSTSARMRDLSEEYIHMCKLIAEYEELKAAGKEVDPALIRAMKAAAKG